MSNSRISLTVTRGTLKGQEFTFDHPAWCIIGRADDCDIPLPSDGHHAFVSRHHCLLEIDPPMVRVRDLGSLNGTYVNGERVGQRPVQEIPGEVNLDAYPAHEAVDGDELWVGITVFQIASKRAENTPEPACFPMLLV